MIFYAAIPAHRIKNNIVLYTELIQTLHANGHSLARDWILPAYYQGASAAVKAAQQQHEIADILSSLDRSDAVIADVSSRGTFGIGYTVAKALEKKKPILLLKKRGTAGGLILSELKSESGVVYRFFDDDLSLHVKEFITYCKGKV